MLNNLTQIVWISLLNEACLRPNHLSNCCACALRQLAWLVITEHQTLLLLMSLLHILSPYCLRDLRWLYTYPTLSALWPDRVRSGRCMAALMTCPCGLRRTQWKCGLQDGRYGVSRAVRSRSIIPEPANPHCRPTWSSPTSVIVHPFTPCSIIPLFHRWSALVSSVLWNSLPLDIQSSPFLTVFRQRLKTFLFRKSFPHILM